MSLNFKQQHLLLILAIASIISTSLYYTDNFIFIQDYPQLESITQASLYTTGLTLTAVRTVGYWLLQLGTLFCRAMSDFSLKMHFMIWVNGLIGFAIGGLVIWSGLTLNQQANRMPSINHTIK